MLLQERIKESGFGEIVGHVLEALEPLSIFGAQLLWIAQPALGLFIDSGRIGAWANSLEDPQTIRAWRAGLIQDANKDG